MEKAQFAALQQTHLVKTLTGAISYVPPHLPPQINLAAIALKLSAADRAIGELRGAARRLQNPYMLIQPLIRKEALTTSAIEGTITTLDAMLVEETETSSTSDDNAREAHNYIQATAQAIAMIETYPISQNIIKDAHRVLLHGLSHARGADKNPGEYKTRQNAIGRTGDDEKSARYVPPPPLQTIDCMNALDAYINRKNRQQGEELIDIALVHYQFEATHPFSDGNGRIGRMLVTMMAQKYGLLDHPLLHISANIENKKPVYIERLFAVSTNGEWEAWCNFFFTVVRESCEAAIEIVDKIINLQAELRARALAHNGNHRLQSIVDGLFEKNWTTVGETQKKCSVTFPTAQSDLQQLIDAKIVHCFEKLRPAIYYAPDIMKLSNR